MTREWEHIAFRPDEPAKPIRPLDSPAQQAHRLSNVESVFDADDELLVDWRRRA